MANLNSDAPPSDPDRPSSALDCDQVQQHLYEYAQGGLDGALRQSIEAHLTDCPTCREEVQAGQELHQILQRTLTAHGRNRSSSADAVLERVDQVISKRLRRASRRFIRPVRKPWKPAVAMGVLVLVALGIGMPILWHLLFPPAMIVLKGHKLVEFVQVEGIVDDPKIRRVRLLVKGRVVTTAEVKNGRFVAMIPVFAEGVTPVTVEAEDKAGNITRTTVVFKPPAP